MGHGSEDGLCESDEKVKEHSNHRLYVLEVRLADVPLLRRK